MRACVRFVPAHATSRCWEGFNAQVARNEDGDDQFFPPVGIGGSSISDVVFPCPRFQIVHLHRVFLSPSFLVSFLVFSSAFLLASL